MPGVARVAAVGRAVGAHVGLAAGVASRVAATGRVADDGGAAAARVGTPAGEAAAAATCGFTTPSPGRTVPAVLRAVGAPARRAPAGDAATELTSPAGVASNRDTASGASDNNTDGTLWAQRVDIPTVANTQRKRRRTRDARMGQKTK